MGSPENFLIGTPWYGRGLANINQNCHPAQPWDNLAQQFEPLAGRIDFLDR